MYSATFIFEQERSDAEFERLDGLILAAARAHPDYLGEEQWQDPRRGRAAVVYYWSSLDGVRALSNDAAHLEAKSGYRRWYKGYHVIIAQVIRVYGDGAFEHPTAGRPPNGTERAPQVVRPPQESDDV